MKVTMLSEWGHNQALFGIGLSYGLTTKKDYKDFVLKTDEVYYKTIKIAEKLAYKQGGHNKFLETMIMWLDVLAPRYWWQEFDTYRVGITKQSESTIHTIGKTYLDQRHFAIGTSKTIIDALNINVRAYQESKTPKERKDLKLRIKKNLPEGFLQRRIIAMSYKTLQNQWIQRRNHLLFEWEFYFEMLRQKIGYPYYIFGADKGT